MVNARYNLRLQKIITAIGILLFIIKITAWYFTGSVAILTDALESIVNVIAGMIGVYSLYISGLPKDVNHPYGHGKAEFLSAAVEGTLITVAGCMIIYKAIENLIHPRAISQLDFGIVLVCITAVINYIAGSVCVRTGKKKQFPGIGIKREASSDGYLFDNRHYSRTGDPVFYTYMVAG